MKKIPIRKYYHLKEIQKEVLNKVINKFKKNIKLIKKLKKIGNQYLMSSIKHNAILINIIKISKDQCLLPSTHSKLTSINSMHIYPSGRMWALLKPMK